MGFPFGKIQKLKRCGFLVFCIILLISARILYCAESQITLEDFVFPQYSEKDRRLQMVIFGKTALNKGRFIYLSGAILDPVAPHVNAMSQVNPMPNAQVKPYLLQADDEQIMRFWKDKSHSNAMIFTKQAVFDRNSKMCRSDEKVSLRSRELDADGVGFDLNLDKRTIHVRSQVRVILRPGANDSSSNGSVQSSGEREFSTEQKRVMNKINKQEKED